MGKLVSMTSSPTSKVHFSKISCLTPPPCLSCLLLVLVSCCCLDRRSVTARTEAYICVCRGIQNTFIVYEEAYVLNFGDPCCVFPQRIIYVHL